MAITTINESDLIKDSRTVINSNFTELDTLKAPLASPALTGTPTAPTPNPGDDSMKLATTEYVQEEIRTHANLPVGFEYFSVNPNIPQGSLPLFGGEYSRETYADLWTWVQAQTGYLKTEIEWLELSVSNNGNVPYYSDGDGLTTFRVPSLKCWVKGANGTVTEVGSYLAAGLPNITGSLFSRDSDPSFDMNMNGSGAVTARNEQHRSSAFSTNEYNCWTGFDFNASLSNSIYGNSETVQPPSVVGMWLVKAWGVVIDTGVIDEQQYIDDRIAAEVTRADGKYLPVTGGTMSGEIIRNTVAVKNSVNNSYTEYLAGTDETSSYLVLYGKNHPNFPGRINIRANNGTTSTYLTLDANGSFTLAGYRVLTNGMVNGHGIQSGTVTGVSVPGNGAVDGYVTYSTPFASKPIVFIAQTGDFSLLYTAVSTDGTTRIHWRVSSGRSQSVTVSINWMAIG